MLFESKSHQTAELNRWTSLVTCSPALPTSPWDSQRRDFDVAFARPSSRSEQPNQTSDLVFPPTSLFSGAALSLIACNRPIPPWSSHSPPCTLDSFQDTRRERERAAMAGLTVMIVKPSTGSRPLPSCARPAMQDTRRFVPKEINSGIGCRDHYQSGIHSHVQ